TKVAVTDRWVGHTGKGKRRLGVGQTPLPPEKQPPDGDLKQVNHNEPPREENKQQRNRPEPRRWPRRRPPNTLQNERKTGSVNDHGYGHEAEGQKKVRN